MGARPGTAMLCIEWEMRIRATAPDAPPWLRTGLASFLANELVNSDGLLSLADALEEASVAATMPDTRQQLRRLADLPRQLAPYRAPAPGDVG